MKKYILIILCLITNYNYTMQPSDQNPDAHIRVFALCVDEEEEELCARITAMYLEQAQRAQQVSNKQQAQETQSLTPIHSKKAVPVNPFVFKDGTTLVEFIESLKKEREKEKAKNTEKKDTELTMFATYCAPPEFIAEREKEGYKSVQEDGITVFYPTGQEHNIQAYIMLSQYFMHKDK